MVKGAAQSSPTCPTQQRISCCRRGASLDTFRVHLSQVSCSWLGAATATAKDGPWPSLVPFEDESQLSELQLVTDLQLAVTHENALLASYELPSAPVVVEEPHLVKLKRC